MIKNIHINKFTSEYMSPESGCSVLLNFIYNLTCSPLDIFRRISLELIFVFLIDFWQEQTNNLLTTSE